MKRYLVDTNVILRFLLEDIPAQANITKAYFLKAKVGKISITIPLLVFIELDFALRNVYKFKKETIIEKLMTLANLPFLDIEKRSILVEAFLVYRRSNVSFIDSLFYCESKMNEQELLTFDNKLKKLRLN